ncbi:hypothetical protein LY78DRAFT_123194 [Colletotrichum sublineola]|nr:hypothetical protein LY78DRAFT_123194 [Colletotrichum sublineola]
MVELFQGVTVKRKEKRSGGRGRGEEGIAVHDEDDDEEIDGMRKKEGRGAREEEKEKEWMGARPRAGPLAGEREKKGTDERTGASPLTPSPPMVGVRELGWLVSVGDGFLSHTLAHSLLPSQSRAVHRQPSPA